VRWALLLGTGCYSEREFRADYDEALCRWKYECFDDGDVDACVEDARSTWKAVDADCEYSAHRAHKCVNQVEDMECPDNAGTHGVVAFPVSCEEVWTCP
jgi:hypothetical protein